MALAAPSPQREEVLTAAGEAVQALMDLLGRLSPIRSVHKIGYRVEGTRFELWVLLREDVREDAERIFQLERDYHLTPGAFPVDLHVVALDQVDEAVLPAMHTVFTRE